MHKIGIFALAGLITASFYAPANAQTRVGPAFDCNNPQNALTYYCNNRDQFDYPAPVVRGPAMGVIGSDMDIEVDTTGSIMPDGPYMIDEPMDEESDVVIVR